jgi:hypothetical protein
MAILARVNRIIGAQDADMESHVPGAVLESRVDEDFGEAVTRDDVPRDDGKGMVNRDLRSDRDLGGESSGQMGRAAYEEVVAPGAEAVAMASEASTPKTKRKRHKTANAIDDLFRAIL